MTDENDPSDLEKSAEDLKQEVRSAVSNIFERDITPQEFYYLMSRYPYLELCDADYPFIDKGTKPKIITAETTGWKIYNYGTVLAVGSHELVAMMRAKENKDDDDEGGTGTIVQQYSETAMEMVALAKKQGWRMAEIVAGFYPMQRMAWIAGEMQDYALKGFDPGREDYVVLHWVSQIKKGKLYPPEHTIPGFKPGKK